MAAGKEGMVEGHEHMIYLLRERKRFAERLLDEAGTLRTAGNILGMQRIEKQIKSEIEMLEKLLSGSQSIKDHHIKSTNLLHLEGVIHIIQNSRHPSRQGTVTAVERFFKFADRFGTVQNIMVDVVCNGGSGWVKVFARKRQALHKKWLGDCNFGEKSVTDFAKDYISASQQNNYNFHSPSIYFVFFDGVTHSVAASLKEVNITVVGPIYPDDSIEEAPSPLQIAAMFGSVSSEQPLSLPLDAAAESKCSLINMDVSSMLAWVSSITHSKSTDVHYHDSVLAEQARQELSDPLWPTLERATEGKSLLACKTAVDDFKSIVSVVAGPSEKERASELLSRLSVVPDEPSERSQRLHCSGKIKERAKIIFGTGDTLRAVTLTANEGFVRAAAGRGVIFNVIVHSCRALAELDYKHNVKAIERKKDLETVCMSPSKEEDSEKHNE